MPVAEPELAFGRRLIVLTAVFRGFGAERGTASGTGHRAAWLVLASVLVLPSAASATSTFIDWTSATSGSGGGIDATIAATITLGDIVPIVHPANEAAYVAEFSANHSALAYATEPSGPGDIESTITFSSPLPAGSRLIALDLDANLETFTLLSRGVPLTFLEQVESRAGQSSIFPSWNPTTGKLIAQTTAPALNDNEASIFDVSGLSEITVDFQGGGPASGSGIAIALPIPEPGTATLTLPGILAFALRRRRPARSRS